MKKCLLNSLQNLLSQTGQLVCRYAAVVNYDFPNSPHSYIHRIGRSGRAGRPGAAVTLFTEEDAERGRRAVTLNPKP